METKISQVSDGLSKTMLLGEGSSSKKFRVLSGAPGTYTTINGVPGLAGGIPTNTTPVDNTLTISSAAYSPIGAIWIACQPSSDGVLSATSLTTNSTGGNYGGTAIRLGQNPVVRNQYFMAGSGFIDPAQGDTTNFRSDHAGVSNFAFADGSVRSVADGVDNTAYQAASTRAGAEVAGSLE
jgi:prepilin-type processing-associated H-X9-DG protein